MQIRKVYNANVYIDGTTDLLGRASEVDLPDIAAKTEDHNGLGMIGTISLPTGLDVLECKIKWNGWYDEHLTIGANPFATHRIQVRASVETYDESGRVLEEGLVVTMAVRWKKAPLGALKQMESPELEDDLSVQYIKVVQAGRELLEIDTFNNIWKVNGTDVLATYRKNLGAQ